MKHTNGLVPQFIRKQANIHEIPDDFIEQVQNSLNHRPRKILGGKEPYEFFLEKKISQPCAFKAYIGRNNELCRADHFGAARFLFPTLNANLKKATRL